MHQTERTGNPLKFIRLILFPALIISLFIISWNKFGASNDDYKILFKDISFYLINFWIVFAGLFLFIPVLRKAFLSKISQKTIFLFRIIYIFFFAALLFAEISYPNRLNQVNYHGFFNGRETDFKTTWNKSYKIYFNSKLPEGMNFHNFIVTWKGWFLARKAGNYLFKALYDDGVIMKIESKDVIDDFMKVGPGKSSVKVFLKKGFHQVKINFIQKEGKFHCLILCRAPDDRIKILSSKQIYPELPNRLGSNLELYLPNGDKLLRTIWFFLLIGFGFLILIDYRPISLKRKHFFIGIFLISISTLLLEIVLTRIFSVIFFNHFTFMIISTALFGFSLSGVLLSLLPRLRKLQASIFLPLFSFLFAISLPLLLRAAVTIPVKMDISVASIKEIAMLALFYLVITVPFVLAGLIISYFFSNQTKFANHLYFFDLLGASLGCSIPLLFLPFLGGSGTFLLASLFALIAAYILSVSWRITFRYLFIILILLVPILFHFDNKLFPIQSHETKRDYLHQFKLGWIEYTRWSNLSRIDVSRTPPYKTIWIDGGTNQSFILPFNGDFSSLKPMGDPDSIPYRLTQKAKTLIVGPAGGKEVMIALSHGAKSVDAVEMDPGIVKIMKNFGRYVPFSGGLYDNKRVNMINDEGRSFIKRSFKKYDVIQEINNATPISIASGAFNLSETYLLTYEAFQDYWNHLSPNGILAITRWGAIRLCSLAYKLLREQGIKNPEHYVAVLQQGNDVTRQYFLLKKGIFTTNDIELIRQYDLKELYIPGSSNKNLFSELMNANTHNITIKNAGFNLFPISDNRPFFNHFHKTYLINKTSPKDIDLKKLLSGMIHPDKPLILLLGEAAFLALFFIILPLTLLTKKKIASKKASLIFILYFSALGLAFILVEITYIQRFILFMGHPVYSVTTVLFALLISAGIGSYISHRFSNFKKAGIYIFLPLLAILFFQIFFLQNYFTLFLSQSTVLRFLLSFLIILPLGIFMGMPFPWGLKQVNQRYSEFIPWAWGVNGYTTVIGSILCVLLAVSFGFKMVLFFALFLYFFAFILSFKMEQ